MPAKSKILHTSNRHRDFKCGEVYHIFQRGNHEAKVFLSDQERGRYLNRFFMLCRCYHIRVHNFALMSTHIHFVLEPRRVEAISNMMRDLQSPHARAHNKLINKKGNLWTQHYGCKHVDSPAYYRTLMHYVEQNPVKTGHCKRADQYLWSGARAHAADGPVVIQVDKMLTVQVELYLDRWREECAEARKMGWTQFLQTHEVAGAMRQKIEEVMDAITRLRSANQERIKQLEETRKAKRAFQELIKNVGPGRALQMAAEANRAKEDPGRSMGAG